MSSLTSLIPEEEIRKEIAANNYLPESTKDHMTMEEFNALYGLDALQKLTKDKDMLEFLFGRWEQNANSLTYVLESSQRLKHYYGAAKPGTATTKILNHSIGSWKNQQKSITEEEAIEIAWKIRNSLINILQQIDDKKDAVEIYQLLEKENLPTAQPWLKKYFTIMFPDKFMPMLNNDWIYRIFWPLGITTTYSWYENAKKFAEKAAYFAVDSITLYHVVRKCVIDHVKRELVDRGINPANLASEDNLLVNTQSNFNQIRKYISEEECAKFEAYLAEKYGWEIESEKISPHVDEKVIYKNEYTTKVLNAKNVIFRGAPGTGKTYLAKEIAADIVSGGMASAYKTLTKEQQQQIQLVQFHPSYDYSDFVEGLRPKTKEDGTLIFELEDGIFKKFVNTAIQNPDRNYVFIIDEINRGEISKILGELFFCIDPDYRGDTEGVLTQYASMHKNPEERFYIPTNVYIIGTMNDIDRSVDTFDFAMRRRFRFIEIVADKHTQMLDTLEDEALINEAKCRMSELNKQISKTEGLNPNYHIGAAYFRKLKDLDGENRFAVLWSDHIAPLLQEYVNGMHDAPETMERFKAAYDSFKHPVNNDDDSNTN